jgi:hypothetical protein
MTAISGTGPSGRLELLLAEGLCEVVGSDLLAALTPDVGSAPLKLLGTPYCPKARAA